MSYTFPPDVQSLVGAQMATGRYATEDDLLREALSMLAQDGEDDDFALVKEALDAMDAGDKGLPLAEAFAAVRERIAKQGQ